MVTSTYSTVTMASEPKMPRGRSRFGFLVSSAAVATTSNPMNAKNTSDAAASTPNMPNDRRRSADDQLQQRLLQAGLGAGAAAGSLGGMNGERLLALK